MMTDAPKVRDGNYTYFKQTLQQRGTKLLSAEVLDGRSVAALDAKRGPGCAQGFGGYLYLHVVWRHKCCVALFRSREEDNLQSYH